MRQEPPEIRDVDVIQMVHRFGDHPLALVERKQRFALLRVDDDGDEDPIEDACRALNDVDVAQRERVE